MCYYSVEAGKSRDAALGDVLEVRRQPSEANWLVDPNKPRIAVCLKTGAMVKLEMPVELQERLFVGSGAIASFYQACPSWADAGHSRKRRDVFEFANGETISLRDLPEKVRLEVRSTNRPGDERDGCLHKENVGEKELVAADAIFREKRRSVFLSFWREVIAR